MATIAFKPMWKTAWKTLLGGLHYDEDDKYFEIKIDSPDQKEQIHIVMNENEARIQARYAIYAMIDSGNINYVKQCIKDHKITRKLDKSK